MEHQVGRLDRAANRHGTYLGTCPLRNIAAEALLFIHRIWRDRSILRGRTPVKFCGYLRTSLISFAYVICGLWKLGLICDIHRFHLFS